jgi:ATP-dependent protease HslVU (ClpYQ) peptidase subunit
VVVKSSSLRTIRLGPLEEGKEPCNEARTTKRIEARKKIRNEREYGRLMAMIEQVSKRAIVIAYGTKDLTAPQDYNL